MLRLLSRTLPAMAVLLQAASPAPVDERGGPLKVVATTTNAAGQVIDWVEPQSQGRIASPPPVSPFEKRDGRAMSAAMVIPADPAMNGPEGTVPILRSGGPTLPTKRLPEPGDDGLARNNNNNETRAAAPSFAGQHWYASSGQVVANRGGRARFSLYRPYVQSGSDFSLLQTAVIRRSAAHAGGTGRVTQTVEAGWINYPNQVQPPHLFAFYTTNGYRGDGDGVGGWNRDRAGWVQVDRLIYPGVPFGPLSADGGGQYEVEIGFLLYQGNWWLWAVDRYVGYYPGSLFAGGGVDRADTLAAGADAINFYGEIFNSVPWMTTTDMGSGRFPESGFGHAAFIRNIVYVDPAGARRDYDGGAQIVVSDRARYRLQTAFRSGSSWGSYVFLGGPGAGGVVGG
ncbi:hypothetical protein CDD83_8512 [Cordyceps sp. RAO-2017]|nr:hypothetical protein CDD83_8512 [Cordyceps sp. RAO-2017]